MFQGIVNVLLSLTLISLVILEKPGRRYIANTKTKQFILNTNYEDLRKDNSKKQAGNSAKAQSSMITSQTQLNLTMDLTAQTIFCSENIGLNLATESRGCSEKHS